MYFVIFLRYILFDIVLVIKIYQSLFNQLLYIFIKEIDQTSRKTIIPEKSINQNFILAKMKFVASKIDDL